ncbi:tyrosine-type recombinase/integrase [Angustibacter luteus]|uniref:Tyrosine-type recombinase/integrase n=1 Tax=Angustibacter luteus TaxID=658456 RepID=A0ABW1JJA0_9ACTN
MTKQELVVAPAWTTEIDAWNVWMTAADRPDTTRYLRTYHLRRLGAEHPLTHPYELTAEDLLLWIGRPEWSTETRRSYRASLRVFYGWAHAEGRITTNPAYGLPSIRPARAMPRPAPTAVVNDALAGATIRERLMLLILAKTGARRGELAQVHTRDLEGGLSDGWSLRLHGKGGKQRLVPIDDQFAEVLLSLDPGYLFPGGINGHLSAPHVGRIVSRILGPGWTAHTLRHRFATAAYAVERDLRAVQELLGHAKPETTAVYTLIPDDSKRRAALGAASDVA